MTKKELLESYKINTDGADELNFDGLYDIFIDYEIVNKDTLETIAAINGSNMQTLLDVLYVKTGLRSIEQLLDELADNNE